MKPLFLFRPEPGWSVSAETARAMGLQVCGSPLFEIEGVDWTTPKGEEFDGLLVGSANVFRHAGEALHEFTRLPVHAVGKATADAARAAGFLIGQTGEGGLQTLLDQMAGRELSLLRLAGEDRVALTVPDGVSVTTRVVYRAVPGALADSDVAALRHGGIVALHSGAAAARVAEEVDRVKLDRAAIDIAAIGSRVAEVAGDGWRSVHIADSPDDTRLLELARSLCQAG